MSQQSEFDRGVLAQIEAMRALGEAAVGTSRELGLAIESLRAELASLRADMEGVRPAIVDHAEALGRLAPVGDQLVDLHESSVHHHNVLERQDKVLSEHAGKFPELERLLATALARSEYLARIVAHRPPWEVGEAMLEDAAAEQLIADSKFFWHQSFHLSKHVLTPGAADIEWLLQQVGLPPTLTGKSLLDIGTTNGGAAFIAERCGAQKVVAVDIYDADAYGFETLRSAVGSRVEFVKASVYELPQLLNERFDEVLFLGVLYHLRHPLLALDALRQLTRGHLYIETAISVSATNESSARFLRRDELAGDGANWFAPTVNCLVDWVESSGFIVDRFDQWPEDRPERAFVVAHPAEGPPEFEAISYEVPLMVSPLPTANEHRRR